MLEKMSEMIAEQLNCDAAGITAETSFKDDLGADSLDLFELVMALEDEYNIEIPARRSDRFNNSRSCYGLSEKQRRRGLIMIEMTNNSLEPEMASGRIF